MFLFSKKSILVTHNGKFHADDVFACATLLLVLKDRARIIRTRDEDIIKTGDYVFDVGGIYNPEINRFDHHQKEGAGKRKNGIPYASFGLVWKKFGKKLCESQEVADMIDQILVQQIDAGDNGVQISNPVFEGIFPYNISTLISSFLPTWKENEIGKKSVNEEFLKVTNVAKEILQREIIQEQHRKEAEKFIIEAYEKATDKRIIKFKKHVSWKKAISKHPEPLFVIFPGENDTWPVVAVRDDPKLFKNRKDFPKEWAGLRDKELAQITGVPDAIFCHRNLFLAVAKSKEGAIQLAKLALRE